MQSNKVVFDFDRTYIRINSFPYWIIYLILLHFFTFRWYRAFGIVLLLLKRKLTKQISHQTFKQHILEIDLPSDSTLFFCSFLKRFVHKEVSHQLIQHLQKKDKVIISSAAPEIYLKQFFSKENVTVMGAHLDNLKRMNENHGKGKVENLYHFEVIKEEEKLKRVFTDSEEDVPLGEMSEEIILVRPNENTILAFESLQKKIKILK